jgi:cytochrome c-type biogenesis protein CcmH
VIWLAAVIVAALALAGVLAPWWWPAYAQRAELRRRSANVAAYRGRLEELEADVQAGVLAPDAVEATQKELAARLIDDTAAPAPVELERRPATALLALSAAGLLVFAGLWYGLAGTWRTQQLVELAKSNPELARAQAADRAIERLRERVASHPDDADAWLMLGRSYFGRGNHADAAQALGRASELKAHQDPDLLVEHGEALSFAQNRSLAGAPSERFAQALTIAPEHPRALWFSGIAAFQAGNGAGAIDFWERLLKQPLPDDTRATLEHSVAMLRERAGLPPAAKTKAPAPLALRLSVTVAPELAASIGPDDALFVFAQDAAGPPMPLAVQRLSAAQLPAQVTLDDTNSMTPERKLSSVDRWRVVARVSRSGNAVPQPGDLEGSIEVGKADAGKPLQIRIDRRRP